MVERSGLDIAVADARVATLDLLEVRAPNATVCPSEVTRALAGGASEGATTGDWRSVMPAVHASVDQLLAEGCIWLSWKGKKLTGRAGPYRINRSSEDK